MLTELRPPVPVRSTEDVEEEVLPSFRTFSTTALPAQASAVLFFSDSSAAVLAEAAKGVGCSEVATVTGSDGKVVAVVSCTEAEVLVVEVKSEVQQEESVALVSTILEGISSKLIMVFGGTIIFVCICS